MADQEDDWNPEPLEELYADAYDLAETLGISFEEALEELEAEVIFETAREEGE